MVRYRLTSLAISSLALLTLAACEQWKPNRVTKPTQSVGTELYGILCDRLVAQNFPEDLENRRFNTQCHRDDFGNFTNATQVDKTPLSNPADERSRLAEARVAAFVKHREELIRAFETLFPDNDANFLNGFKTLLANMTPLYDQDIPNFINTATVAIDNVIASPAAVAGLTRISNREGYRPITSGGGLLGVLAAQPVLTNVMDDAFRVFGRGQDSEKALNQFLFALNQRALEAKNEQAAGTKTRSLMQILNSVALAEADDQFTPGFSAEVAKRDACGGVALTTISAPFADVNADGCADTDAFGRFLDKSGAPITAPSPFLGLAARDASRRDAFGHPLDAQGNLLYQYVDTRRTALTGILANTYPLMQPSTPVVLDLGSELAAVLGDRTAKTMTVGIRPVTVDIFNADSSPMLDIVRSLAPALKAAEADGFTAFNILAKALRNNQVDSARLVGALVNAKNLANADTFAKYNPKSTLWDEFSDVMTEIADYKDSNGDPVLLKELLEAMARPEVVALGYAKSQLLTHSDVLDYDPADVNYVINTATGQRVSGFSQNVNRSAPAVGNNRSAFHRLLATIHEARGVRACNKNGAKLAGLSLPGELGAECALFKVPDAAVFFVQTLATGGNPNSEVALMGKGHFPISDQLQAVFAGAGLLTGGNTFEAVYNQKMQHDSGINGLTMVPTPQAVTRMLFFRPSEATNPDQKKFFEELSDPAPSAVCPLIVTTPDQYGKRVCASPADTMAQRHKATFFALEQNGLYAALQPIAVPFVKYGKENLFLDLLSAVYRHWDGADATCSSDRSDVRFCSKSGMYTYEPLLAQMFEPSSDLIASLQLASKHIVDADPSAFQKLSRVFRPLFSRELNGLLKDRNGKTTSLRNDGTENPYLTPVALIVKSLDDIDNRRAANPAGVARWRSARSKMIDQLFAVEKDNGDVLSSRLKVQALGNSLPLLLDQVAEEMSKKAANNTFLPYVNGGLLADARDAIESPLLTSGLDLLSALRKDPSAERNMLTLLSGALDPSQTNPFAEAVVSITDGIQALNDETALRPVMTAIAPALDPDTGAVKMLLNMLESTNKLDTNKYFTLVTRRTLSPLPGQARTPMEIFSDTVMDVNRADPTQSTTLDAGDMGRILSETRAFLADESTGLKQLITIIQKRNTLQ